MEEHIQSHVPVVLFVDEKIPLANLNVSSLFEDYKNQRGYVDLSVNIRTFSAVDEIGNGDNVWVLACHGNGFRMNMTKRFTPSSFKAVSTTASSIKNVIVVNPGSVIKNTKGMLLNVFAWIVKNNKNGPDQPFYGKSKKTKIKKPKKIREYKNW